MHFSTRFTIALHTLLCIAYFQDQRTTSEFIAASVGVNAVVIRRILGQLKKAELITTHKDGARLCKSPEEINLYAVLCAVEEDQHLFAFHPRPEPKCPVGAHIHEALDLMLYDLDATVKSKLQSYSLSGLLTGLNFALSKGK